MIRLDLGCGVLDESKRQRYRRYGIDPTQYAGVDHVVIPGAAVVADLDRPLPFADASVHEVVGRPLPRARAGP